MAIKRPDIYEHNNPNFPIADSDYVKGGIRTKVANLATLYALSTKTNQLKEHSTFVWVVSESKYYVLIDIANAGNSNGWRNDLIAPEVDLSGYYTSSEVDNLLENIDYNDLDNLPTLDFIPASEKGAADGVAETDENNKILLNHLPEWLLNSLLFGGSVNAETGVATLSNNAKAKLETTASSITLTNNAAAITGYEANEAIFYVASNSDTLFGLEIETGDWLVSTGSAWIKIDNTDTVKTVNGEIGNVTTPLDKVLEQGHTATDKSVEFKSATPDSSKVTFNNEEVRVENDTDGKSTKVGVQEIEFRQGMHKMTAQPEALTKDNSVIFQNKDHTVAGLDDILSDAIDIDYDNTSSGLSATNVQEAVDELQANIEQETADRQLAIETAGFIQRTGTAIAFDKWATYGTYASPVSGNLSYSFTNMVKGMIQVMYHEDYVAPTLTDVGVTVIETGDYVVENINKITIHCIDEDVVEVNIKAL